MPSSRPVPRSTPSTAARRPRRLLAALACPVIALTALAVPVTAAADEPSGTWYSSKQPYTAPSAEVLASYSQAPAGYTVSYTESVARHGSRGLSSYKYDALLMLMARTADAEDGFVSQEARDTFMANLEAITAANVENGYGMLTGQGATQHEGLGERAYQRNEALFSAADASGRTIELESSGEARATESGESWAEGLVSASGGALSDNLGTMTSSPDTLYFHKVENPDGTEKQPGTAAYDIASAYEDYIDAQTDGGTIEAAMDYIESLPRSEEASTDLLSTVFTPEFIARIGTDDAHTWYNTADGTKDGAENCAPGADPATDPDACGEAKKSIKTAVDAAMDLYNLDIIAADMTEENTAAHSFDFDQYFSGHEEDAEWFSYLLDAEDFYEKGPSLEGHDETYTIAEPLLDDFLDSAAADADGSGPAATFRFAHAETIIPFAALLGLPGSTQQAPDVAEPTSTADVYSYENNEWRGESVTMMAANVQWDVATREGTDPATGDAYTPLVRMLYNEQEIAFMEGCTPVAEGSTWYKLSELGSCLAGRASDESPLLAAAPTGEPTATGTPSDDTGDATGTETSASAGAASAATAVGATAAASTSRPAAVAASGTSAGTPSGSLARTGVSSTLWLAALGLLASGAVLTLQRRRSA